MLQIYDKSGQFDLDTTQDLNFSVEGDETAPRLYSIHLWWENANDTDGTLTAYVGADIDDVNSLTQIGSQILVDSTNTSLNSEIINYEGLAKAIKIKYAKGSISAGTGYYRIIGAL